MATDQHAAVDPVERYPQPDFGEQPQPHPGRTGEMSPTPDHGEDSYVGAGRLTGRKALVTGGDSGIGKAVALAFAREGADVVVSCLPEEEDEGRDTVRLVEEAGRRALLVPGDQRDEATCRDLVREAVDELDGLDLLVVNAAYQMTLDPGIEALTTEQLDRTLKTNLYAMFWLCQAAWPHLQPGSSVITTASVQAYQPTPALLDYASTKGAIVTFTKGLAAEGIERGVRVNCVAPGPVWTPLIPATMPPEQVSSFGAEESPIGRPAQPAELAPPYVFLASGESSYVSGQVLGVTGGKPL